MIRLSLIGSLAFHLLAAPALAQAEGDAVRAAIAAGDRQQLANLVSAGAPHPALAPDERLQARLLLMERLAVVDPRDRDARREAAMALLALFPEDRFVRSIAGSEGIDTTSSQPTDGGGSSSVATTSAIPGPFESALRSQSAEKLIAALDGANFVQVLPVEQVSEAEKVLLDYVRPLPAANAEANRDGYRALATLVPGNTTYREKAAKYADAVVQQRSAILKKLKKKLDEFSGVTFWKHPNEPRYTDTRTYLAVYAATKGSRVWLRMRLNYTDDSWLFVESASFNIDGNVMHLPANDWKRDNDSEIWEWVDVEVEGQVREILKKVAASRKTVVRFNGQQYYENVTIGDADKQMIRDMFLAEEVFKEQSGG